LLLELFIVILEANHPSTQIAWMTLMVLMVVMFLTWSKNPQMNFAWPLAYFAVLAQRLSCSFLASKHVLALLVTKDESFAFENASLSELVGHFDDSTVNIKERRARGRGGIPRRDHLIPSDDPSMVQ
jgi:hypothetical protein